jgi:hypothetical protein
MRISRQQRRALERSKAKRTVEESNAGIRAARRIEARASWKDRHSLGLTRWQKLTLVFELLFVAFGGPLVWAFYKGGWFFKARRRKTHET